MIHTFDYSIEELRPYINWLYFFHAWDLPSTLASVAHVHACHACRTQWLHAQRNQAQAEEALHLFEDAEKALQALAETHRGRARVALMEANAEDDDVLLYEEGATYRLPLLRQQHTQAGKPNLCLSDYIRPAASGKRDCIGLFAATVTKEKGDEREEDPFQHLMEQTLCDRLAEAVAEKMHEEVRKRWWGYAPEEDFAPEDLFQCRYQGIRPAVGYPSLPDQSLNFLLDERLDMSAIGITLTENGAMEPHGSVSGLLISHPQAAYFAVGHIGEDQFHDYARRRGMEETRLRQFLYANM